MGYDGWGPRGHDRRPDGYGEPDPWRRDEPRPGRRGPDERPEPAGNAVAAVIASAAGLTAVPQLIALTANVAQLASLTRGKAFLVVNLVVMGLGLVALLGPGQARYRESVVRIGAAFFAVVVCGAFAGTQLFGAGWGGLGRRGPVDPHGSGSASPSASAPSVPPDTPGPSRPGPGDDTGRDPVLESASAGVVSPAGAGWVPSPPERFTIVLTAGDAVPQRALRTDPIAYVPADAYRGEISFECRTTPRKARGTPNCQGGEARAYDILPAVAGRVLAAAATAGSCPAPPDGYVGNPDVVPLVGGGVYCVAKAGNPSRVVVLRLGPLPERGPLAFEVTVQEWRRS